MVEEFITNEEVKVLFIYQANDNLTVSTTCPSNLKKKALYLIKDNDVVETLTLQTFREHVIVNEVTESALKYLALVSHEIFYPLLANPSNRHGWAGPASKDIMLKLSGFLANISMTLGQSHGQTILPPPPSEAFDEDNLPEKERQGLLDASVIHWSEKIEHVIRTDPEQLIQQATAAAEKAAATAETTVKAESGTPTASSNYPDPITEVEFWQSKARDLASLEQQLASPVLQVVHGALSKMNSHFAGQFHLLAMQVSKAQQEAAENYRYLNAIMPHFRRLRNNPDFQSLMSAFQPMMYCILLMWKNSKTYNTNHRLVVLVQEICNAIITEGEKFVSGEFIFNQINNDNVTDAVQALKVAIQVCTKFKQVFLKYKAHARKLLAAGHWEVPQEQLFHRLDAYLERCNDALEFCRIVVEFNKLTKIHIGGSKGALLTTMILSIHNDFRKACGEFERVPYDILDITQSRFDDDFYQYRCRVKELDGRLAYVLSTAFDDSSTISAQLKLLESFEGLLERPVIKDELDRKQSQLLRSYLAELMKVQEHFHSHRNTPFITPNMPPVAGALGWCRALRMRITEPNEKLRQYTQDSDRDEVKEIERCFEITLSQLMAYESKKVEDWTNEVDQSAQDKLHQPLLKKPEQKDRSVPQSDRLYVNFDDALVRLLREVKYLLGFGVKVAPRALTIYDKSKVYRKQQGELTQIVTMYNEVQSTLVPVERPLVEKSIAHLNEVLAKGINDLNWNNPGVSDFIKEAMVAMRHVYTIVTTMKNNFAEIKKRITEFAKEPLVERKNKPITPAEFEENLRQRAEVRHKILQQHQQVFTAKLAETAQVLAVSKSSQSWRAYVEHVQETIREGLAQTIVNSMKYLCDQIEQAEGADKEKAGQPGSMGALGSSTSSQSSSSAAAAAASTAAASTASGEKKALLQPMLEIKLVVSGGELAFYSDDYLVGDQHQGSRITKSKREVWSLIMDWADNFYDIGNKISRMDGSHYVGDLKKNDLTVRQTNALKKLTENNSNACRKFQMEEFKVQYESLKTDRKATFNAFLQDIGASVRRSELEAKRSAAGAAAGAGAGAGAAAGGAGTSTSVSAAGGTGAGSAAAGDDVEEENTGSIDEDDFGVNLNLAKAEAIISRYRGLYAEVEEKESVKEVGFLRINTAPVKHSLMNMAKGFINMFTSFLADDVKRKLDTLDRIVNEVTKGVENDVHAGDSENLKKVLGFIHRVRSKEHSTLGLIEPLEQTVALLKKFDADVDESVHRQLASARKKWESVVNLVYKIKERVNVLQNGEVDKIKQKVRNFSQELSDFREVFRNEMPFRNGVEVDEAFEDIFHFHLELLKMESKAAKLMDLERVFELSVTSHQEIKKCRSENRNMKHLWDMIAIIKCTFGDWRKTLWDKIDADTLIRETNQLRKQLIQLPAEVRTWEAYQGIYDEVQNMIVVLPMVNQLHSPYMKERHWDELTRLIGCSLVRDEAFCLNNLLEIDLHKYPDHVNYIEELAKKEAQIQTHLEGVDAKWSQLTLSFAPSTKIPSIKAIKRPDLILATLEEHMSQLQTMQGQGKYVEHFIDRVNMWQARLNTVETVLTDWLDVQKRWGSLEPIYRGSADIQSQLPEDAARFEEIDSTWRTLMTTVEDTTMVIDSCQSPGRAEMLATLKVGLEQCNKSLNQYLEMKRKSFPRYYFLANPALLDMLSSGEDPHAVQRNMADCFDNLHHLTFKPLRDLTPEEMAAQPQNVQNAYRRWASSSGEARKALMNDDDISKNLTFFKGEPLSNIGLGMNSKDGDEYVPFHQEFMCVGAVENWLARLVQRMRDTLKEILGRAKFAADHWDVEKPRYKWQQDYPAQIALTASQIIWTEEVNAQFDSFQDGNEQAMKEYAKVLASRLEDLITLVLGDLSYCERVKVMTLITVDVHNRDVVAKLIDQKVLEASAFAWQSQMRFTWEDQSAVGIGVGGLPMILGADDLASRSGDDLKECYIKVADGIWPYMYEYVGNTGRLVITPLTDRCYITLTQALRLIMGGAPAGPAGTGKTETTKDLGRAMANSVYVFNCSEQMNVQSMSAIFKGLAQTGAWGCFDEFNRIQVEVLSVISTQVSTILNAIRARREEFDFMGDICRLVPSVGMFITMNPGYAGRTELPENLKALFRSCAMVVPDMDLICENMLMSEGFLHAQRLTKKFVTLYSLCASLLSKQRHYDWGLRACKAVLRVAGGLKRADRLTDETRVLMRALRDFNSPKLVDADKPIFGQLIDDLFPGLSSITPTKQDPALEAAIKHAAAYKRHLQAEEKFVRKCVELSELLVIRHSVFVIGPSCSGKSEIWRTLCDALNDLPLPGGPNKGFHETVYDVINPKAVLNKELYGWLSKSDWHDGVLSKLMREMNHNDGVFKPHQTYQWAVLDGDIDPEWIESLNCFPADDHQILAEQGYMFLHQVQRHFQEHETLNVACYVDGELTYMPITKDKVTIKSGNHTLVNMRGKTGTFDISATANHRMYGIVKPTRLSASGQREWRYEKSDPPVFEIKKAGEIYNAGQADPSLVMQFQASAADGFKVEGSIETAPFMEALGMKTSKQGECFVRAYGYWIGDGYLDAANRAVCFSPVKEKDRKMVVKTLLDCGLKQLEGGAGPREECDLSAGKGFYVNKENVNGQQTIIVSHSLWWDYFVHQYGHMYEGYWAEVGALEGALMRNSGVPQGRYRDAVSADQVETRLRELLLRGPDYLAANRVLVSGVPCKFGRSDLDSMISTLRGKTPEEPCPPPAEDINSAKWFWWWVWKHLDMKHCRYLIQGLKAADDSQTPAKQHRSGLLREEGMNCLFTSSPRSVEEYQRLALHAGYSAFAKLELRPGHQTSINGVPLVAKNYHWNVYYSDESRVAQPRLVVQEDFSKSEWNGTVWCVTVPTKEQLIVVRRVLEQEKDTGVVLVGSKPIVCGNTVMDDNKMLTLVSNERISLTKPMRLVFEISNLDNATPATVSRAGIIYINATDIGSKPFLDSWVEQRSNDKEKSTLLALFNRYVTSEVMTDMILPARRIIPVGEVTMVRTLCYLLEGLLDGLAEVAKENRRKGITVTPAQEKETFEATFVLACIWAFGGAVFSDKGANSRSEFSERWKTTFTAVKFPASGTKDNSVFDYFVDEKGKLASWASVLDAYQPPQDAYLVTQVFIPTSESVRMKYILDLLVEKQRPALLVGSAGTGKTKLLTQYLRQLRVRDDRKTFSSVNVNYYTDAKALQKILESHIDKRAGRIYGPAGNKKLIYFIDDLNMAYVDTYGTQSCIELIKQHMDYKFWYDTTKLEKKEVHDVQYVASMNPFAGSFTVSDRLQGQFATFAVLMPDLADLRGIYGQVMRHHLSAFAGPGGMANEITELCDPITKATVDMYDIMANNPKFVPSTRKFHYLFNLRDLSAVFQGLCMSVPKTGYTARTFVQLWIHECFRVFGDRLVDEDDVKAFEELLEVRVRENFRRILQSPGSGNVPANSGDLKDNMPVFASFVYAHDVPTYLPVDDMSRLKRVLTTKLDEYNQTYAAMNLELFNLAMYHICRIVRILENPQGNALLVGVGGSGKQSLCRLAAHICGCSVVQLTVTQEYSLHDLRSDMQELYRKAGVKQTPIVFMLCDTQILHDSWLSLVNDLLCSGNIPGLFNDEDLDQIVNSVRNDAKSKGVPDSREALIEYFIAQVRANLHVVLCFSPVGEAFRVRCRKFPGIINCSVIDWFHPWPHDALVSVAKRFLFEIELGPAAVLDAISDHMAIVHESVGDYSVQYRQKMKRYNYTTPKSFLELISFYKKLLLAKRTDLTAQIQRLQTGISTLIRTKSKVEELEASLKETMIIVNERTLATQDTLKRIEVEQKKVEEQQIIASHEASEAKKASEIAAKFSADCQKDLDDAMPIMVAAKLALSKLSKPSLGELRGMTSPTADVTFVTEAVMILLGIKGAGKDKWAGAKLMMKDLNKFLSSLQTFDATLITEDQLKRLQPILSKDFFNETAMKQRSEAAANLCEWVVNIVRYHHVLKMIRPKEMARDESNADFNAASAKLKAEEEKVSRMQKKVKEIADEFAAKQADLMKVQLQADDCTTRLQLAQRLVNGLADENKRWTNGVAEFNKRGTTMVGDVMLAASFVSYLGAFDQEFRVDLWKNTWIPNLEDKGIALTPDVDPLKILANDSDFARWKNEGLAADRSSLENGAIICQGTRWPLMIDPQLQGIKWVRGRLKNLITVQQNQPGYLNTVSQAIANGMPLLIDGCPEELDASLDPILSRQFITRGTRKYVRLGTEEIPYDESFQLFLQTKLANPHYRPEIFAQCTLINFIVTESGLEDQLLAIVVDREQPDLEEKRTSLVRAINDYMVSLTDLETEILTRLMDAPPDILSDVSLIDGLEKTKSTAMEVGVKVDQAREQEATINAARSEFQTVAAEGSWLYFLLIQLNYINHMYQFSLNAFVTFFRKAMARTPKAETTSERVALLRENIRMTIFTWVTRGLFERHKLIFSSQLCFKLMLKGALQESFNHSYYDFLIQPSRATSDTEKALDWVPKAAWEQILFLSSLEGFEKLSKEMANSPNRFKEWYLKARPESTPLPLEWRKLDDNAPFMKLLVVRALRPDRMIAAMENYVRNALPNGKAYVECDAGKSFMDVLSLSLDDATSANPIFFILSPGADPVGSVEVLARRQGMYDQKFHRIALGQGQDIAASQRLDLGAKEGHWVVLENIHLMPVWLKELEKKLDDLDASGSHPDFRVFLSAEPSDSIPIGILERSLKLTNEPPQGLKQNLKRAFATFDKEHFDYVDTKVKSILFGLCHFHSVIIERTKFGPKGWNRVYPFNTGDLLNSATVIQTYLDAANNSDSVPWKDLRYMVGEILYGGHITDDWDRLVCNTYLKFYLRDELLDEMELYPFSESYPDERFRSPPVLPYEQYFDYVDSQLVNESPVAFGMHPNEEIAVKTNQATTLFARILELSPAGSGAASAGAADTFSLQTRVSQILESVKGINFTIDDIVQQILEERGPFQNVFLQEAERMNILVSEINRSLNELSLGLSGELQMSESMEKLQTAIQLGRIPKSWENLSYASQRSLSTWVSNLVDRAGQLQEWTEDPVNIPVVVAIDKLFNPQSFLTAIMQKTAQRQKLELDKLVIQTEVTRKTVDEIDARSRDGAYISGLYLEGARLNINTGTLEECAPREMFFVMPVITCKAILAEKLERTGVYRCPVYKTQQRGPTYVFTANLRSKQPAEKWTLAGVTMVLETAD